MSLVTIDEPFYVPIMVKNLLKLSPPSITYNCIVIVPSRPKKMSLPRFFAYQLGLFGLPQFTRLLGLYVWKRMLDMLSEKEYSVIKIARKEKITIIKADSLKDPKLISNLRTFCPDIILSIASSRIFGKDLLSLPRIACINVHAGRLPTYRGINPSFWALLNREEESAITVHYMNEKIDDGDIIAQDIFSIKDVRTLNAVYLKVVEIAPKTILKSLIDIEEGQTRTSKNDSSLATYYSFPTKADARKFRSKGLSFL